MSTRPGAVPNKTDEFEVEGDWPEALTFPDMEPRVYQEIGPAGAPGSDAIPYPPDVYTGELRSESTGIRWNRTRYVRTNEAWVVDGKTLEEESSETIPTSGVAGIYVIEMWTDQVLRSIYVGESLHIQRRIREHGYYKHRSATSTRVREAVTAHLLDGHTARLKVCLMLRARTGGADTQWRLFLYKHELHLVEAAIIAQFERGVYAPNRQVHFEHGDPVDASIPPINVTVVIDGHDNVTGMDEEGLE